MCSCHSSQTQKAATPGKGKAKKLKVVLLKDIPPSIPKGSQRNKLRNDGRIEEVAFHRSMTVEETRRHIQRAFESVGSVNKFQYLQGHKDNTLKV